MKVKVTRRHLLWTVAACLAAAVSAGACSRADRPGGPRLEAQLPVSFAQLSNVVELPDGRVVFADTRARVFLRGDLASGKVDTLGARSDVASVESPAGVYKFPGWVARLAGDTIALVDFALQRTTLWNPKGEPLGMLPIKEVAGSAPVLIYDTVGHGYKVDYQAVLGSPEPGRALLSDSTPVLRISLRTGVVDTVAQLAAPEYGDATFGEQVQQAAKVFAPTDHFGVLGDGTAWVARGRENRVDWRAPDGTWSTGRSRDYAPIPVTQEDRDVVLARVREQGKRHGMPQGLRIVYPFADTKPPFDFAMASPEGEVWLQRSRAADDPVAYYDVFDRTGAWRREVAFPKGAYLAGFGRDGAVYVSMKEGDGRTVARYRLG